MEKWQVESNVQAFGHYDAAVILRKKKVSFERAYFLIFGCYPSDRTWLKLISL